MTVRIGKAFCYFHDKKIQKQTTLCQFLCEYLKKCKKEIETKKNEIEIEEGKMIPVNLIVLIAT